MSTTHLDTGSTGSTSGISGGSSSSSNSNSEFEIDSWYMQEFEAYNIKTINDSVVIIKKMVKKIKALIDENAKLQSNVTKLNAKLEDISKFIDDPNFLKFIKTETSVDHLQMYTICNNIKQEHEIEIVSDVASQNSIIDENVEMPIDTLNCYNYIKDESRLMSEDEANEIKRPFQLVKQEDVNPSELRPCTKYECTHCKRKFSGLHLLKNHFVCHSSIASFGTTSLNDDKKLHNTCRSFKCGFCSLSFKYAIRLSKHIMQIHKPEDLRFNCDKCAGTYQSVERLRRHTAVHDKKFVICQRCNVAFPKKYLSIHCVRVHGVEIVSNDNQTESVDQLNSNYMKPFECNVCNKRFSGNGNLKAHYAVHTGEKPFKCEFCNMCFRTHAQLKQHIRVHTGEKPYKCKFCDRYFRTHYELKMHTRVHHTDEKPLKCEFCDKGFRRLYELKLHIRVHTGERPFKCEYCNKSFGASTSLKSHIRAHANRKSK